MLEWWNQLSLGVFDVLLGWLLRLPGDVRIFVVAIGSALILTLVRLFTTNQDLLSRAAADRTRLRQLIREAKGRGDKASVKRFQATRSQIAVKTFKAEGMPLLVSILPIAMLATWCLHRLDYLPPRDGEAVRVEFHTPVSAVDGAMHLVPQDGLAVEGGYVQRIEAGNYNGQSGGVATWTVRGAASEKPYRLAFRFRGQTHEQDLLIGQPTYSPPETFFAKSDCLSRLVMRPLKLFGVVPGIPAIVFPPWLVAYLIIVIPFVFLTKRVLHIR